MSFIDNLKGTLKSLIGTKTEKVVEEAQAKAEVKVEEVKEAAVEVKENADEAIDSAIAKVDAVMEQASQDLKGIMHPNENK